MWCLIDEKKHAAGSADVRCMRFLWVSWYHVPDRGVKCLKTL